MIRHIFTTGLVEGTSEERLDEIIDDLRALERLVPGMKKIEVAKNLGWYQKKAQLVLITEFDSKKDWEVYMTYPQHLKVGEDHGHLFDETTGTVVQIEF